MQNQTDSQNRPKTAIIIDCWPDLKMAEYYRGLRRHVEDTDYEQILWASFSRGELDSHFLHVLRDPRHRLVLPEMTKTLPDTYRDFSQCVIMGRSWPRCVWDRHSFGLHSLLCQGKQVLIDLDHTTHRNSQGEESVCSAELFHSLLPNGVTAGSHAGALIEVRADTDFWD